MNTLRMTRDYERTARKIADYRNHLRFNLRCRQHRLIPNSLRLGSTVKSHRARMILEKTQNQLLNEKVRQVHFPIEALNKEADSLLQKLKSHLPSAVLEKVTDFIEKAQLSQHAKSKERQTRKFQNLQS